ncbi:MAG TPA: hypothetical protein VGO68_16365 [Pyrinomonadaceae bacterium]|jgi:hypothetical protein|nr:hypothetical protein [Pyrinomonadaceae bacterium]
MKAFLLALLLFSLLLTSCSPSAPTETDATKYLNDRGSKSGNLYQVKRLRKTNGKGDDKSYIMDIEVELECLRTKEGPYPPDPHDSYEIYVDGCTKGETIKQAGKLGFVNTEKGWVVYEGMNLY